MDMNPITVLSANAAAKPSASPSTGVAKEPFSQVLSAHQAPEMKKSAPDTKASQSDSDDGKKNTTKKTDSATPERQDKKSQAAEVEPLSQPSVVTPTPVTNIPLDLSLTSLGLVGEKPTVEATKGTQALASTQKPTSKDLDKPVSLRDLLAVRTLANSKESIGSQGTPVKVQAKTSQQGSAVKTAQAGAIDSKAELRTTEVSAKVPSAQVENRADAVEQDKVFKTPDTVAAKQDVGNTDKAADEEAAATTSAKPVTAPTAVTSAATAPMAAAVSDAGQPASVLKAAAEKIGAVISATVHAGSRTAASRSQVSAVKAAVAPEKIGAAAMPQIAGTGATRHDDSQKHGDQTNTGKRDGSFPEVSAQTTTESKGSGPEVAPEAASSASSTNKGGAPESAATNNARAVTSQSAAEGQPGRTESANVGVRQNANPLPINVANTDATLDFGAWSKTSLIERFRQSEMQFGMQAGEFGRIEVRTVLDRHEVTARISVERGDLGKALESELPGLQKRLHDLDVPVGKITLQEQSAAMSGESGRRSREQQWTNSQPLPQQQKVEVVPKATMFAEQSISTEGLSVRI
jgi:hypothetical protein